VKSGSEVIEVNFEELAALLERARQGPLGEEDCQRLEAAIDALSCLIEKIGEKNTTISELRALLMKPSTEKTEKVLERAGLQPRSKTRPSAPEAKAKPGHGRNGAEDYRGAVAGVEPISRATMGPASTRSLSIADCHDKLSGHVAGAGSFWFRAHV
jgi:hypothetical protein